MASEAVKIVDLSKSYGETPAVGGVSLSVRDGETLVLLGPSGCGKTTILRCIAGLEAPDSGLIELDGKVVATESVRVRPEKRRVGMVFQSYALWPHLSVLDNVIFAARRAAGLGRVEARSTAEEQLEKFGLGSLQSRMPAQLSGGQQQRVALARAVAAAPRVLLMDEPLSALDQQLREDLRVELRASIAGTGLACVYVTHDQREAMAMADKVAILDHGRLAEFGPPRALFEQPDTLFGARFLGARNLVRGARVVRQSDSGTWVAQKGVSEIEFVAAGRHDPKIGGTVDLAWRPESSIAVTAPATHAGQFLPAEVEAHVFLGNATQLQVRMDSGEEILALARFDSVVHGEKCYVHIDPKEILGYVAQ